MEGRILVTTSATQIFNVPFIALSGGPFASPICNIKKMINLEMWHELKP